MLSESATRHAIPRSLSSASKHPSSIQATTGRGDLKGDIALDETPGAAGKTISAAADGSAGALGASIATGTIIRAALA